jgi:hypothetical protein
MASWYISDRCRVVRDSQFGNANLSRKSHEYFRLFYVFYVSGTTLRFHSNSRLKIKFEIVEGSSPPWRPFEANLEF